MSSRFEEYRSNIKVGDRGVVFLFPVMDEAALRVYPEVLRGVAGKRGYMPLTDHDECITKAIWNDRPTGIDCVYIVSENDEVTQVSEHGAVPYSAQFIEVSNSTSYVFFHD